MITEEVVGVRFQFGLLNFFPLSSTVREFHWLAEAVQHALLTASITLIKYIHSLNFQISTTQHQLAFPQTRESVKLYAFIPSVPFFYAASFR